MLSHTALLPLAVSQIHTALLPLAVIQILISGSQAMPQSTLGEDHPLCLHVDIEKCNEPSIKINCIHLCATADHEICEHIKKDRCQEVNVMAECPRKCRRPAIVTACSPPWFLVGNECFLGVTKESEWRTWNDARAYCSENATGGELAQPENLKALADYVLANGYDDYWYWLGGSDLTNEGVWRWNNGSFITTGWRDNRPRKPDEGGDAEDCLYWLPSATSTGESLFDKNCGAKERFFCQRH